MSSDVKVVTRGGINFSGLLAITFIVLKLTGVIGWSWWWVLSPIWIPVGLIFTIFVGIGLVILFLYLIHKRKKK